MHRLLACLLPVSVLISSARAENSPFTGSYQATLSASTLGAAKPSLGHRLGLSYAPSFGGSFDSRTEYYVEGSYNGDPPGVLRHNVNEPKFEQQLMFNRGLGVEGLGLTVGLLYHYNFKFFDQYYWAIAGLTHTLPLGKNVTLSTAAVMEKKLSGARWFSDVSGTLEWRFTPGWNTQLAVHHYENVGETDLAPTHKREIELGVNWSVTKQQTVGVSFFRHIQFGAANDQFSFVKLKYGVNF